MTKTQLSEALHLAQSKDSLANEDTNLFDGFATKNFKPVICTIRQLAVLVRWRAVNLNGTVDMDGLNEVAYWGRLRFQVV